MTTALLRKNYRLLRNIKLNKLSVLGAVRLVDVNNFSLCDAIPTCHGAVVVAGRQVNGKGINPSATEGAVLCACLHRGLPYRAEHTKLLGFSRGLQSAGINVTNSRPTVCLNDMVPDGSSIKFSVEEVIAETLNRFEYWLNMCEIKGQTEVLKTYYKF
ncbi:Biotin/lipoate A/B protein ligase [Parelaphostrongylus tenuis]|uniref:Biotin/lipoate A/B protein ligase n=1 Tax=Parelaphostrongylus tenuis TaxID=148309 RepID=A0AAD5WEB7_PARTN|nr:Biotin/lipoate A/B protein ligase [Parelaphostrongylus tenuis]